ncbi:MAG: hypothetical protein CL920_25630 [Deltaproteobacteria bacterium]|nr:hypothetical protein [Deltaproteobacteria bacterium]MBU52088.1 hypothetical protein [Deltaproteobacteria bacterium]
MRPLHIPGLVLACLLCMSASVSAKKKTPSPKHDFKTDADRLCHMFERSGANKHKKQFMKAVIAAKWVEEHVHNKEVLQYFKALSYATLKGKLLFTRRLAKKAGLATCPLVDRYKKLLKKQKKKPAKR